MSDTNLNEENIRFDASVINMLTKMGTMGDRQEYTMPGKLQRWSQQTLEDLARIKVLNNVATALPDAAIRRGWDLTLGSEGDNDLIELFNEEHERLEVPEMFNEAQFEANIYGGAAIVIVCDDGKPAYEPIDIKNLKSIISLEVLDRYKIEPDLAFTGINPLKPERYRLILPEYIKKDLSKVIDKNPRYLVHESRIIRFDAHGIRSTPEMLRQNQGWGESLLSVLWEDYKDWKSSLKALGAMVQDCSIFTHKIKNFSQMIKQKEEHLLQARLTMLRMMVSVFGGIAIDSENEDVSFPSRSFAGVDQISNQQRDAFIGASGIPHDRLFGESPSGLGATGESEEKNWASTVSDFQTSRWSRKLKKLFKLIFQSKEGPTKGKIPKGWGIEFADLILMSEADKASLRSTMASSDSTYLNSGVLLPEEIRESRFGKSKYSIETTLDDALFKKKQKESEQQNQFGGFPDFGGEQLPPEEVPPEEVPPEEVPPEEVPPEAIQQDSWDYRADAVDISTLEQKDGKVFYRGRWWKPNDPMPSDRQGKKRMVLAKEGNQVALVHYGAKGYDHNYSPEAKRSFLARMKEVRTKDGKPAYKDKFSPAYWAIKDLWNPSEPADGSAKYDVMGVGGFAGELNAGTPRTKRVVNWNGIGIGITHEPGDVRFPMAQPMKCGYGHVRGSYGQAPDKKAFDVYVGDNLSAANGYKVRQIDPTTGFYDEDKYFIGFKSPAEVREMFTYHAGVHRFGGIEPLKPDELGVYRQDNCGCSVPEIDNGTQVLSGDRKIKVVNDENILIAIQSTFPETVLALGDWMVTAEGNIGGEFFTDYGIYKFGVKRGINDVVTYRWNRDIRNDSRVNERKGYHWVEDKRVKDGGYWRKNPGKSTSLQSPDKQNKPGDKKSTSNGAGIGLAIAGGVTALGIAGGVTALTLASRGGSGSSGNANPPNPEVEKTKSKAEQEARARSEQEAKVKAEQERIKQEQEAKVKIEQEKIKSEQAAKSGIDNNNVPEYKGDQIGANIPLASTTYLEEKGFKPNEARNKNHTTGVQGESSFWINNQEEELFVKFSDNKYHAASESVVAFVGKSMYIPVNDVTISYNKDDSREISSTLHSVVPGKTVRQLSNESEKFKDIASTLDRMREPWDLLSVINKHPDFAKIYALDVYTRNRDVHSGNIIFDEKSNKAYGIDKGFAFSDSNWTNRFVNGAIESGERGELSQMSTEEKENLKVFVNTLKGLSESYPPGTLSTILINTRIKTGVYGSLFSTEGFQKDLGFFADRAKKLIDKKMSPQDISQALFAQEDIGGEETKAACHYTVSAYREKQSYDHIQRLIKYYEEKLS